jgi:hypothetical protein
MSQIPAELIDHIIDYLHADKDALVACSMVCKTWLPGTWHHVFGQILCTELSTIDRLFALINSPLSTITPYVRHLNIGYVGGLVRLAQLAVFTAVQSMTLRSPLDLYPSDTESTPNPQPCFNSLKALEVTGFKFDSNAAFLDFMRGCPNLEHLSYSDRWWEGPEVWCHFGSLIICNRIFSLPRF